MSEPIPIAQGEHSLALLPAMANRHGLIAGATGTGKTTTLRVMAEGFSRIGVPVFMADVKGDLSGIALAGADNPKIAERVKQLGLTGFSFAAYPVTFWDLFGEQGHPVRTTVSDMGPLLLSRLLDLNETQAGVLTLVFKVADDNGLLLLDLKDLQAMLADVAGRATELQKVYGNVSSASVGAIQRGLLGLDQQGAERFFGEPALNLDDMIQTGAGGLGVVNLLAADRLMTSPKNYATFLLWLMSELFERLPEVGDQEKPKMVFFFDEAHLLFNDIPRALLETIEQVVRLIRSKGVGIYFITQNPLDIPERVLGQLGNRVQHALRAFTPADERAVRAAARTFRSNPKLEVETIITQLGVGEALVSFLDENGTPGIVQRALVRPPQSRIGPMAPEVRQQTMNQSLVAGVYEKVVDRESAYEILKARAATAAQASATPPASAPQPAPGSYEKPGGLFDFGLGRPTTGPRGGRQPDTLAEAFAKSAARAMGSQAGRQILRGVLGTLFGTGSRR